MKVSDIFESNTDNDYEDTGLYHSSEDSSAIIFRPPTTNEREPRDTMLAVHRYTNELAIKKFGIPIRNSLFGSYKPNDIVYYGGNIFYICIIPSSTRFFVNPAVRDFTEDYNMTNTSFREDIVKQFQRNPNIDRDKFIYSLPYSINDYSSFDTMYNSIIDYVRDKHQSRNIDAIGESVLKEITELKDRIHKYVSDTKEITVDDLSKYKTQEIMVYSTSKIKLMNMDHDVENM